jgi:hypothetical protein
LIIEPLVNLARDARRRHIEIASEIERHRAVQYAAYARHATVDLGSPDPLKHLVYGVGVSEDVVRRLPVGVLVGIAEARHAECRGVSERTAEVGRSGACADRRLKRVNDPGRIVTEQPERRCTWPQPEPAIRHAMLVRY